MRPAIHTFLLIAPIVGFVTGVGLLIQSQSPDATAQAGCSPFYPDFCIPNPPPDLDCTDIVERNFHAYAPDPHGFDTDGDSIGCEDPQAPPYPSNLSIRAYLPMIACDSCVVTSPTPTATPTTTATSTATATPTQTTATATPTTVTATPPTATASPTVGGCSAATATITALNKSGNPETVTISGSGLLTGWYLISESGNQRYDFPAGYTLSGTVTIASGSAASSNPPGTLLWTTANVWNNTSDDDAFLYDCQGTLKSTFEDGD